MMSDNPKRKNYVGQSRNTFLADSRFRSLPDIKICTT